MSPIIDLQRRMVEAGRIRAGDKGPKGEPRKIENWRLTSRDRVRLDEAAKLWGGEVREWEGQWELYTETEALPIMLLPGQLPTTWYELWSRGGCQRRCDGQHELMSDSVCLCDGDQRECKPYTRLSVLLPDLPGIGSWMVTSKGWNAAAELAPTADILQRAAGQGVLIPARLRLEQRSEVKAGQTRRFAVPVLDVDVSFRELLGGNQGGALGSGPERAALPSGYTPIEAPRGGSSLADSLAAAETQEVKRTTRSAAPIPSVDVEFGGAPIPPADAEAPPPSPAAVPPAAPAGGASAPYDDIATKADQLSKLVGSLRRRKVITTEHVWAAVASTRNVDVDVMVDLLKGRDSDGKLHWPPLRDDLQPDEILDLHGRLSRLNANAEAVPA